MFAHSFYKIILLWSSPTLQKIKLITNYTLGGISLKRSLIVGFLVYRPTFTLRLQKVLTRTASDPFASKNEGSNWCCSVRKNFAFTDPMSSQVKCKYAFFLLCDIILVNLFWYILFWNK